MLLAHSTTYQSVNISASMMMTLNKEKHFKKNIIG